MPIFVLVKGEKIISKLKNWEAWPFNVLYAPIAPVWLSYILKSRAVWFFTPANPKITFGGMIGETKSEIYSLLPKKYIPITTYAKSGENLETVKSNILRAGLTYPFVVKPDMGEKGIMFRRIENETQLVEYHSHAFFDYVVQEFCPYPLEVSVFYTRLPNEEKGIISGFFKKIPLQVKGNGKHSLEQLVQQHTKARERINELYPKHRDNWKNIIPAGEIYMLSYAGNHNRGATFENLKQHISKDFVQHFDALSKGANDLFYGRYDIMCSSVEDLLAWKNFMILEFNGVGAEPNHIYDAGYKLTEAYKELTWHWKRLYQISWYNKTHGIIPWTYTKGKYFMRNANAFFEKLKETEKKLSF